MLSRIVPDRIQGTYHSKKQAWDNIFYKSVKYSNHSITNKQTCGTYAIEPQEYTDPWTSCISPKIELNKDDLPEPTWEFNEQTE